MGGFWEPKSVILGIDFWMIFACRSKTAPRPPKCAPRPPKRHPRGTKRHPRPPKRHPKGTKRHPKAPQEHQKAPKKHPKGTQKAPKSTQKAPKRQFDRCSRPWACFVELIRCSRPWPCFGELKLRFPFACCSGFRGEARLIRSKIDQKNDQNSTSFFDRFWVVLGRHFGAFWCPKSTQVGPNWCQDGS